MLYLIHFDRPYKHARHYLGWTKSADTLDARLDHHRAGTGARLLAVLKREGIGWQVSRTWLDGTKQDERKLKRTRNLPHYCPVCQPEIAAQYRAYRARRKANGATSPPTPHASALADDAEIPY